MCFPLARMPSIDSYQDGRLYFLVQENVHRCDCRIELRRLNTVSAVEPRLFELSLDHLKSRRCTSADDQLGVSLYRASEGFCG